MSLSIASQNYQSPHVHYFIHHSRFNSAKILAVLKCKYPVYLSFSSINIHFPSQAHSGSDWSDGDSERAVRVGAGRRGHHQPAYRSHPGERGVDRRCLVRPLHCVLLFSHNDNYTQEQHSNHTYQPSSHHTFDCLFLSFSVPSGLVSHCISILKVIFVLLQSLQ